MFLFVAWYFAVAIIAIGLIGSALVTVSPGSSATNDPLALDQEVSP
jgi:hypothetical protein